MQNDHKIDEMNVYMLEFGGSSTGTESVKVFARKSVAEAYLARNGFTFEGTHAKHGNIPAYDSYLHRDNNERWATVIEYPVLDE